MLGLTSGIVPAPVTGPVTITAPVTTTTPVTTTIVITALPGDEPAAEGGFTFGTAGSDRIGLAAGATAVGKGGDDVYVLASSGQPGAGSEFLGLILDFQAGDKLDLSSLGAKATILTQDLQKDGGERIGIDYDGDGREDGFVVTFADYTPPGGLVTIQDDQPADIAPVINVVNYHDLFQAAYIV